MELKTIIKGILRFALIILNASLEVGFSKSKEPSCSPEEAYERLYNGSISDEDFKNATKHDLT